MLEALSEGRASEVVEQMDVHASFINEDIMAYAPRPAGGIMSDSFVAFFDAITF